MSNEIIREQDTDSQENIANSSQKEVSAIQVKEKSNKKRSKKGTDTDRGSQKSNAMKRYKSKKIKKVIKSVIIILILCVVAFFVAKKLGLFSDKAVINENMLTTYTVSRRTITEVIESTGTIEPNDQYTVTPLVTGEILEDYFEEGDTVLEDQPLYLIDSESGDSRIRQLNNAVEKAENALEKAIESLDDLYIESTVSGTIEEIYFEVGDSIKSGDKLADVIDKNTMLIDIPFFEVDITSGYVAPGMPAAVTLGEDRVVSGTVRSISTTASPNSYGTAVRTITIAVANNGSLSETTTALSAEVNGYTSNGGGTFEYNDKGSVYATASGEIASIFASEGQWISDGAYFLLLSDEDVQQNIDDLENNVEDALINLEDAEEELDNYKIKSPKTGKIVTKSYKKGDTVSGNANGGTTLAIIYDMSALKFTMSIDELDIDKLEVGQEVIVTCDSRSGKEYKGSITNISILGTTSNGTTTYPVEVTIENTEDETQRTVDEDGTIHRVYKTGMTSTTGTYSISGISQTDDGTLYTYENGTEILKTISGDLYCENNMLKSYGDSYVSGDNYYTFSDNFEKLTLEIQNTKEMLRIAMNVDASIVVEKHENVIAIPQAAVGRGDVVKVIKESTEDTTDAEDEAEDISKEIPKRNPDEMPAFPEGVDFETANPSNEVRTDMPYAEFTTPEIGNSGYGTAPQDSEYEEVRVTTGASDDDYIEITSGLNEGDVVIIDNSGDGTSSEFMQPGMMGGMGVMGPMGSGGMPGAGQMGGGMGGGMPQGPMGR